MATQLIPDPDTRDAISRFVKRIAGRYVIDQIWLYGSRARGDAGPESDADVAVVLGGPEQRTMDVGIDMAQDEVDVLMETGILIQAMPIHRAAWDDPATHRNPYLVATIKREGIAIH